MERTDNIGGRKKKLLLLLGISFVVALLFCACSLWGDPVWTPSVPVMLLDADGVKITSSNPAMAPLGGDAVFQLALNEDVVVDSLPEGAVLENGKLTVKSVFYPVTLKLETHRRIKCDFSAITEQTAQGSFTSTLEDGTYWSDTQVTLTATPKEGYIFAGYSAGGLLSEGGTLLSLDPNYSFTLSENLRVYANFETEWIDPATQVEVPEDQWVLLYHSNGGVFSSTGNSGIHTQHFDNTYYLCPNAIADRDYFERDGYLLYGYNTKADGTGTFYGMGWAVVMPEWGAISLFCMWAKISDVSDFDYTVESGGIVTLDKYKGSDEFVVLPENIGGKPVREVSAGAFRDNTTMKKVMINKNIRTLNDGAFQNCTALEEMYFTDAVTKVGDGLLSQCDNFHKLYMLAYVSPRYRTARNGTYGIKYERLITAKGKKLVVASGSNTAYGLNSPLLEELLKEGGQEYSVVNYGQNLTTPLTFYLEVISAHINEGDLVILAPEIDKYQFGHSKINNLVWQIFEGAYNAFSDVDIRGYTNLFSSFNTFNKARDKTKYDPDAYEDYSSETVNMYGDYSREKKGHSNDYQNTIQNLMNKGGVGSWNYRNSITHIEEYGARLNSAIDLVTDKGGTVLISFAATCKIALKAESQIPGGAPQQELEAAVDRMLHGVRISQVATYTMDTEWFYNSHNHLSTEGAKRRTGLLATDILNYLSSNG